MNKLNITNTETDVDIQPLKKNSPIEHADGVFAEDVIRGLSSKYKYLQSKYFYDNVGDRLFQEIMACEEYYPFDCELEIFSERTADLARAILAKDGPFDLIELGAGDCTKSIFLLKYLNKRNVDFTYLPIDISSSTIDYLEEILPQQIEGLKVKGLNGEYFEMLHQAASLTQRRKVVMFLGSNLGNMSPEDALAFCREIRANLNEGDLLLIGIDLKKNPKTILAAYDDSQGITKNFNLNLLARINRELGGNFDISKFEHYASYDPHSGGCRSYLISTCDQKISIAGEYEITFAEHEHIFMEISQKYNPAEISMMGAQAGFKTNENFFCKKKWFLDTIWEAEKIQ